MEGLRQTSGALRQERERAGRSPPSCPLLWSGRRDLNPRPQRPERCALPSCATSRAVRQSSGSPRSAGPGGRARAPAAWPRAGRRTGTARTCSSRGLARRVRTARPCGSCRSPTGGGSEQFVTKRSDARQAHLTAVRVAGDHEVVAQGRGLRSGVRRVHDREPEPLGRAHVARPAGRASAICASSSPRSSIGSPFKSTSRRTFVRSSQPSARSCATRSAGAPSCRRGGVSASRGSTRGS